MCVHVWTNHKPRCLLGVLPSRQMLRRLFEGNTTTNGAQYVIMDGTSATYEYLHTTQSRYMQPKQKGVAYATNATSLDPPLESTCLCIATWWSHQKLCPAIATS